MKTEKIIFDIKEGWTLMKTTKQKPMGFVGYIFTLYEEDDITIKKELFAKTAKEIADKIKEL